MALCELLGLLQSKFFHEPAASKIHPEMNDKYRHVTVCMNSSLSLNYCNSRTARPFPLSLFGIPPTAWPSPFGTTIHAVTPNVWNSLLTKTTLKNSKTPELLHCFRNFCSFCSFAAAGSVRNLDGTRCQRRKRCLPPSSTVEMKQSGERRARAES